MASLALFAIVIVLYTYAGYPLLVTLWARITPRPVVCRDGFEPTVSICFAVRNGQEQLTKKIFNLQSLDYPAGKLEILIFADGSTDDTERLLGGLAAQDPRIRFLVSRERLGKPTGLNRLLRLATGEVLLLCDVRQTIGRSALRSLLHDLSDPTVGCVSGSLVLAGETGAGAYWRYERMIRAAEARLGRMVGVSGSIYAVRRADMPEIPSDILLDDMFVPLRVALATGKRIVLAESAEALDSACDDEHEFRRKVRTLAGNYQLVARMPRLLLPGYSPLWFPLISHKVARLVCPWALAAVFCAAGVLSLHRDPTVVGISTWQALFFAQCAFYGAALLGARAGRLGTLARTFVVLNAAAVVGLFRFVRGSQAVTW